MKSSEVVLVFVHSLGLLFGLINAKSLCTPCEDKKHLDGEDVPHFTNLVSVEKSLLILHLDEGKEYKEIFDTEDNNCEFSIVDQDPDDHELLKIDPETHMLTSSVLDREDKIFENMLVPQIQVQLQLNCPGVYQYPHPNQKTRLPRSVTNFGLYGNLPTKFGARSYVLSKDINFEPLTTILTIIIEDINDNSPEFIYPDSSNFSIGYPEPEIAGEILPDYLLRANAVDKDAAENAKIRYKIFPNEDFDINPETGEIYPYSNAMQNAKELVLNIYAVDRNGSDDGRVTMVEIKVKRLSAEHIALLTIEEDKPEDVDITIELLRVRTGIHFKILKKSYISRSNKDKGNVVTNNFKSSKSSPKKIAIRAWIYAFSPTGEPIESREIEKKVSEIDGKISASVVSYKKVKQQSSAHISIDKSDRNTIISFIIVIVVLLLTLIVLIVSFLCWYCLRLKRHKRRSARMSTPSSSTMTTISSIIDDIEHHRCNSSLCYYKRSSLMKLHENGYRSSILKGSSSWDESSDGINRFSRRRHSVLGDISELQGDFLEFDKPRISPDRRKSSVTFNSKVKFINIDFNDDEEDTGDTIRL